ncbi:MAG: radical SAM protein [Candidatus Lernaella stagnicola]|nr:radical SAM protein [Candidatus Lernaella stagnicola]
MFLAILPPFGPEGPPLGLACVTAALRRADFSVCARDFNIELYREFEASQGHLWDPAHKAAWVWESRVPSTIAAFGDAFDRMAREIDESGAAVAGFSVHSDNRAVTIELMRRLRARRPGIKILVGGLGAFSEASRNAFPKALVDAFVVGEGEVAVVEAARALVAGEVPEDIAGVALPGGPCVDRPVAKTLDDFPFPDFSDFDLSLYATPNLPLAMSRGCTKGCTLCNDRVLMGRFRRRSAENVFAEIQHHVETLDKRDFMVVDLQITQIVDDVVSLCGMLEDAGLDIRWNANAAISDKLTPEALRAMRRAGCHTLALGVESGSNDVLRWMNKGTTAQAATNTLRAVKDAGITTWVNFVVGFPGETEAHLDATIAWVEANTEWIDEVAVLNSCNILEYSVLAEKPEKYGILPPVDPDWFEVAWIGQDGNTPQVRHERLTRVKAALDRLGLPVRQTNLGFVDEASHLAGEDHDLLLVLCPPFDVSHPPLELAAIASYLAGRSLKAFALDLSIQEYLRATEEDRKLWELPRHDQWANPIAYEAFRKKLDLSPAKLAEQILAASGDLVYFHLVRGNLLVTRDVMTAIRERDPARKLIIGGDPTRIDAERDLFPEAICDLALIGQPEGTLVEIIRRHRRGDGNAFLRGARWVGPDGEPEFLPREPLRNLDVIGYPTFREFRPDRYESPVLPIRMSRGCRFRCAFCAEQPAEGSFRTRSAASVFAEMCDHHDTWEVFTFHFTDLIANGDLDALRELAERIAHSGRPFRWTCRMAPRVEMDAAFFETLARGGCAKIRFGVESFSDELLAHMNKGYTGQVALDNLRQAHAAGIETHVNLLVGFPGETERDFLATVKAVHDAQDTIDYVDEVTPCYILPGSALERDCVTYGVLLPPGKHFQSWSYKAYNNPSWRRKRMMEMAIWVAGLDVKFNYDFFVPPGHEFRKIETQIRDRLLRKITPAPDVVLVTLPPWGYENPPVGLAYLSSFLRARGYHTAMRDFNIEFYNGVHEIYRMLWHVENKNFWSNDTTFEVVKHSLRGQIDQAVEELVDLSPPILGFSVVDPKERITLEVIRRFREHNRDTRIILGGPACFTPEYRQIFIDRAGDLIDGYVVGEGENTLLEIVERTRAGEDLRNIPGLMILDEQGECRFTPRAPIMDLDTLAPPTYDEFDIEQYPGDSLILEWSRGCIANCTYCKGKQISGDFRMRSAKHIFGELRRHVETHGFRNFTIADNLLNGDVVILEELCDRIIDAGLEFRWNGEAIPLPGMTRQLLDKMAAAGCYEMQWGVESGSPTVLKRMGKLRFFEVEQARRVIRDCHEAGIKTCLFIIVGFPGETADDFQMTLDFIRENAAWIGQIKSINSMHVITGTALHVYPERFGIHLPETDYHYLWESLDGANTPAVRNARIRALLRLCEELDVEVRETNLTEGKQASVVEKFRPELSMEERMKILIDEINDLRSFKTDIPEAGDRAGPLGCSYIMPEPVKDEAAPEIEAPVEEAALTAQEAQAFVEDNLALAGILDGEEVLAGPEIFEIDLTNFCNLDCIGCWNHSPLLAERRMTGEEKQQHLPTELVLRLIDDAAELGAKHVQLSGAGDPLCHTDAMEIIRRVKARGLECTVITNGTLLTEKVCEGLVEAGVDHLTVSVWAGSPEVYAAVHPNQQPKTLRRIMESLQLLHRLKAERNSFQPQVKVYHVVCHTNAHDVANMVSFAVESLAEYVEFTPIDIVPGYTDSLALTEADRAEIVRQLNDLPKREDYLELDPTRGAKRQDADGEGLEFARFVKRSLLPGGFRYELDDITRFDVLCHRKEWRLEIEEDNVVENALIFYYPRHECERCPDNPQCAIDKERYAIKVEFLSFLGYGVFLRRIQAGEGSGYDAEMVDKIPCSIGWTYARVKTDGSVIPCCKADDLPMGNLHEADFRTIWTGETYREFRRKALTTPKSDPYFSVIGCYQACDNLGHNRGAHERIGRLTEELRKRLQSQESRELSKV